MIYALILALAPMPTPHHKIPTRVPVDFPEKSIVGIELDTGVVIFPNIVDEKNLPKSWVRIFKTNFIPDVTIYRVPVKDRVKNAYKRKRDVHVGDIYVDGKKTETKVKYMPQGAILYQTQAFPNCEVGWPAFDKDGKVVAVLYVKGDTYLWFPVADAWKLNKAIIKKKRDMEREFLRGLMRKEGL